MDHILRGVLTPMMSLPPSGGCTKAMSQVYMNDAVGVL